MKAKIFKYTILILLMPVILTGCMKRQPDFSPVSYSLPALDSCKDEPDHHFFITQPDSESAQQKYPLIIVIDPHGDGRFALEKFTRALGDIPVIIVGSEKLKNNYAGFELSLSHLYSELVKGYPVDPDKVIIAGFSGGARMAFAYGMRHKVLGIIMYGAGPGRTINQLGSKRMYAVSGTQDFNFIEQYLPPFSGINDNINYSVDFFRGKHEWPPSKSIYESIAYILKDDNSRKQQSISDRIYINLLSDYDSLLEKGDLFCAAKALEKAWIFSQDGSNRTRLARQIDDFRKMPEWVDYNKKFETYLQKEIKLKQAYAQHLSNPDTIWWKKEINSLRQNLLSSSDPIQEDFLYRIQGFVGIILYSQINAYLQKNELSQELTSFLVIYEYAEPESEDLIKFKLKADELAAR